MSDYTTKLVAALRRQRDAMHSAGQDTSLIDKRIAAHSPQQTPSADTAADVTAAPVAPQPQRAAKQTTRKRR